MVLELHSKFFQTPVPFLTIRRKSTPPTFSFRRRSGFYQGKQMNTADPKGTAVFSLFIQEQIEGVTIPSRDFIDVFTERKNYLR